VCILQHELELNITSDQLTSFDDISANISLFIRSYYLMSWLSRTAAIPVSSATL